MESHPTRNGRLSALAASLSSAKPALSPAHLVVALSVALLFLVADQAAKSHIVSNYARNELIAGSRYLRLALVTNTGGICGYAQGANSVLTGLGVLTTAIIVLSILFAMPNAWLYSAAFGMLLAGSAGNLIDRLRFGYVVDFVNIGSSSWPSFNIADASIVGGAALIACLTFWDVGRKGSKDPEADPRALGRSGLILLLAAGLAFAVAYLFCVLRPLG